MDEKTRRLRRTDRDIANADLARVVRFSEHFPGGTLTFGPRAWQVQRFADEVREDQWRWWLEDIAAVMQRMEDVEQVRRETGEPADA